MRASSRRVRIARLSSRAMGSDETARLTAAPRPPVRPPSQLSIRLLAFALAILALLLLAAVPGQLPALDGLGLRLPGVSRGRPAACARRPDLPAVLPRWAVPAGAVRAVPVRATVRGRDACPFTMISLQAAEITVVRAARRPAARGVCRDAGPADRPVPRVRGRGHHQPGAHRPQPGQCERVRDRRPCVHLARPGPPARLRGPGRRHVRPAHPGARCSSGTCCAGAGGRWSGPSPPGCSSCS